MTVDAIPFDRYLPYDELNDALNAIANEAPNLVKLVEIGKSFEGRSVLAAIVTNFETGPDTDKPAFICDGNIHATEVSASSACLYLLKKLITEYQKSSEVTRALDTRAFYIIPRLNPDGAEMYFNRPQKFIRSSVRPYPYDEEDIEGLEVCDINGDDKVLTMRIKDPNGPHKCAKEDPRIMIPRDPIEVGGEYYRLIPEGLFENYDGQSIRMKRRKERLDMNRNFPAHWRQEYEQRGAGPYPTSEPEVRNLVQFISEHPNITGAMTFHTFSGVLLRPCSTRSDDSLPAEDVKIFKKIGDTGSRLTGYPNVSVYHDFRYHPNEVITGTYDDWMYEHQGRFAWTIEIWSPQRQAGITEGFAPGGSQGSYKFISWEENHSIEDDLKMLAWSDTILAGKGFQNWKTFNHPQLGEVEIGGWDSQYAFRNPPPHLLEKEIAPMADWAIWHCLISPKLEVLSTTMTPLSNEHYRLSITVINTGWLPTR